MNTAYLSLQNKVALVTGGSRGIGEAIALSLADAGADVVVASRKQADLDVVANKIKAMGRKGMGIAYHNREVESIKTLVDAVIKATVECVLLTAYNHRSGLIGPVREPTGEVEAKYIWLEIRGSAEYDSLAGVFSFESLGRLPRQRQFFD